MEVVGESDFLEGLVFLGDDRGDSLFEEVGESVFLVLGVRGEFFLGDLGESDFLEPEDRGE